MPAKTHSKDMEEALKFFGLNDIPGSIKDLNSLYRKLSLKHHPDKNAGSDESTILYQHLQNYYKLIGDFVISNDTPNSGNDEEESYNRSLFKEIFCKNNTDKRNTHCHSIIIDRKLAKQWKTVLDKELGQPTKIGPHGQSIYKDVVYKITQDDFSSTRPVTVTLFDNVKEPKLHLQSGSQVLNDYYVLEELPVFYAEVRKLNQEAGVNNVLGDNCDSRRRGLRERPKQDVKAITTPQPQEKEKSLWCKFCSFHSKIAKEITSHVKRDHSSYDKQRNLEGLSETINEEDIEAVNMDTDTATEEEAKNKKVTIEDIEDVEDNVTIHELISPDPDSSPMTTDQEPSTLIQDGFQEQARQVFELANLKADLGIKNKLILELQDKLKEAEKNRKNSQKEFNSLKKDAEKVEKEYKETVNKMTELASENSRLKEEVQALRDHDVANEQILEMYEETKRKLEEALESRKKDKAEADVDSGEEADDIQFLARCKNSGHRRDTPSEPSKPAPAPQKLTPKSQEKELDKEKCNWCKFRSKDKEKRLSHSIEKHEVCDICDISFMTVKSLREHMKRSHDKTNGSLFNCKKCSYGAVNRKHLNRHEDRHHKERNCTKCTFKTRSEYELDNHIYQKHTLRNKTCKFWLNSTCTNSNCLYRHEIKMCRYGDNCKRINCMFEHKQESTQNNRRSSPSLWSWIEPTLPTENSLKENSQQMPFLGQQANHCQKPCCSRNRDRGM